MRRGGSKRRPRGELPPERYRAEDHIDDELNKEGGATEEALRDGNQCIAMVVGIGGFGAGTLLAFGATCPLCLVAAPGLVGLGIYKRLKAKSAKAAPAVGGEVKNGQEDARGTE